MRVGRELEDFASHFAHYLLYRARKPKMQLERAIVIVSVDVDVGNRKLGMINEGKNDRNVNDYFSEYTIGEIEEQAVPLIINCLNMFEMPATFGLRGQLLDVDASLLEYVRESPIKHDIGSHGYYHRDFTGLSLDEAKHDLRLISTGMSKLKITPKSFVFPRNRVAYLELLQEFGYICYRGYGDIRNDDMLIKKQGNLYDIRPSLYLGNVTNPAFARKIIDLAIKNRLPIHIWFHPWNLGKEKKSVNAKIDKLLVPIFRYAKSKQKKNSLEFGTMLSAAEKMENARVMLEKAK